MSKDKPAGFPVGNQDPSKRGLGRKDADYDGRNGHSGSGQSADGYSVGNTDPDKRGRGQ